MPTEEVEFNATSLGRMTEFSIGDRLFSLDSDGRWAETAGSV